MTEQARDDAERKGFHAMRVTATQRGAVGLLVSLIAYLLLRSTIAHRAIDLAVYSATGDAVTDHTYIYGSLATPYHLRSTYPPFAALLFAPMSDIALPMLTQIVLVLNLTLVGVVAVLTCALIGLPRHRWPAVATTLAAATLWAEPVLTTLRLGQIDLLVLALVLADFARPAGARWRGIGIGLAAAIKIVPAIFILYLLITRRPREAGTAIYTFVLTVAIGSIGLPNATKQYWTRLIFDSGRVGRVINEQNQSLRGLAARLRHTSGVGSTTTVVVAVVAVAGLLIAAIAYRRLGERWGVCACAVTGLLATPIAWTHHWVWFVPITLLLSTDARRWFPAIALFWSYAPFLLPTADRPEVHYAMWQTILSGWYVYFGVGFLGLTLVKARRTTATTPEPVLSTAC